MQGDAWNGGAIGREKVIRYFGLEMKRTKGPKTVLKRGGILNIMHPYRNGHCLFVAPIKAPYIASRAVLAVNSFFGPPIHRMSSDFLEEHSSSKLGYHWVVSGADAERMIKLRKRSS